MPNTHSNRAGRSLLLILVPILVLIAIPTIWIWTRSTPLPNPNEGQSIAEAFLREVREGHPQTAWSSATADFKSDQGQQSFVRKAQAIEFLKEPLEFVSVQTVSVNDIPRSEFLFRSSKGKTVRVILNREAGAWKVDRWNPST